MTKMQRYLERGDTEKAKVEEELARAMALTAQGDRQGLAAMRDRLSMVVTGRASKTSQLEDRLKEAEEQLQQSFRERARLEKQRGQLERELASWSSTLGISIDISRAESVEASEPSGSDQLDVEGMVVVVCYVRCCPLQLLCRIAANCRGGRAVAAALLASMMARWRSCALGKRMKHSWTALFALRWSWLKQKAST